MVKVLDTTLRDGSYVVDFQFSKEDTKNITQTLESFEIPYIEIGHGLGLGAYRLNNYSSICTDEEYMSLIRKNDSKIKYGVFFIPGIGDYPDIDLAIKYNIDFIRIGTNINESEKGLEYIKYAKSKGLIVAANFMKSYAVDVDEFAKRASEVSNAGADFIYLVDSAGGMLPDEVQRYIKKAIESCKCEIGFHGHNNLTLAVANSLAAIEAGATIIDSSLQGLGRDGGNASTEVLLSILMQKKLINKKNINALLDYSEVNILPLLKNTGVKAMPLISGLSLFHSGFYTKIKDIAQDYSVDVREIIIELSNINIIDPSKNDILKAIKIVQNKKTTSDIPLFTNIRKSFNRNISFESLEILINELKSNSKKHNKKSVFNIVVTTTQNTFLSSYTQTSSEYIIGSCQINSFSQLEEIIGLIDGKIDIIFYDLEFKIADSLLMKKYLLENVKRSKLLFYNDSEIWSKAIENILLGKSTKDLPYIYLNDKTYLGVKLMKSIKSLGMDINSKLTQEKFFDFVVGAEQGEIDMSFVNAIDGKTIIIDAGIGSISQDILNYCYENKIDVLRVDMRVVLESEISQKEKSLELFEKVQGTLDNEKFTIVAGGCYGKEGSIIVDSIKQPTCVIGISNGNGSVKYTLNDEEIQRIEEFELKILKGI